MAALSKITQHTEQTAAEAMLHAALAMKFLEEMRAVLGELLGNNIPGILFLAARTRRSAVTAKLRNAQAKLAPSFAQRVELALAQAATRAAASASAGAGAPLRADVPARTRRWLKRHAPKLAGGIDRATRERIALLILDSQAKGETTDKLANRIRSAYLSFSQGRARRIAQHETATISAVTEFDMYDALPVDKARIAKVWRTRRDALVRARHRIEGEVRALPDRFSNGLLYPLDPGAPIGMTINCRCFLQYSLRLRSIRRKP